MAGENSYIRIPPDGAGKKLRHEPHLRIGFSGVATDNIWQLGEEYESRGSQTLILTVFRGKNNSATGILAARPTSEDLYNDDIPVVGDEIWYEGSKVGDITLVEKIFVPYTHISGGDTPSNVMNVDKSGAASIRFSEGNPQVDAFGKLRTSSATVLGDYVFQYDINPTEFSTDIIGNGEVGFNNNLKCLSIKCPDGSVTAPGTGSVDGAGLDLVRHTSNCYHHYFPGFSHQFIATVASVDTGRTGTTRRWGMFDEFNGYFFELTDGTDKFRLVIRSSATGATVDTVIVPTDFNGDPVDGTGDSQMNLDVRDDNIYWIDVQWLGAGRVRFGTYHRGERIVIHQHYHEGTLNDGKPSAQTGSLPVAFECRNTGTTAGETELRAWCCGIHTEDLTDLQKSGRNRVETFEKTFNPANIENGQEYELIGVLAPVRTIGDATHWTGGPKKENRTLYLPTYSQVLAFDSDGEDAIVGVEVYVNPQLGGGSRSFRIDSDELVGTIGDGTYLKQIDGSADCAVEAYKVEDYDSTTRAKLWGGGLHAIQQYVKGQGTLTLDGLYGNHQNGAFKNFSEQGGERTCGISTITSTNPAVITVQHPEHLHREGEPVRFIGITGTMGTDGTNGLNYDSGRDNEYYLRFNGINSAEIYTDINFDTSFDGSSLSYTSGGTMVGKYGSQVFFAVMVEPSAVQIRKNKNITVQYTLGWKEVIQ